MKKNIFYILALAIVLVPSFALAAAPNIWPTGFWGPLVSCTGFYSTNTTGISSLPACTSLCDLIQTIENVIYFGISVAVFAIAPILFAVGGIMFMFSRGNPQGITKAKSILTGALVGVLIVLAAWLIINTVVKVLGIAGVGGFTAQGCVASGSSGGSEFYGQSL